MILHLRQWRSDPTALSVEPAAVFNILENCFGEKGDILEHFRSAHGTVRIRALVTAYTDKMTVTTAVHWAGGWHFKTHWALYSLLKQIHKCFTFVFELHIFLGLALK